MIRLIKIKSTFEHTIDLNDPKSVRENKDVIDMLLNEYNNSLDEGEDPVKSLKDVDSAVLHDNIRQSIADDPDSVLDVGDLTDDGNFEIEVLS